MSFNTSDNADAAEKDLAFQENRRNSYQQQTVPSNDDFDNESECQPCLHHPSPESIPSRNGKVSYANSSLKCADHSPNGCSDNLNEYLANKDLNLKVNSNSDDNANTVKHLKGRSECFSVKYSVSESQPLISENDCKIDIEYRKAPKIMSNPQQRKIRPQRPSSLDNISESVLNNKCKDKTLVCMASTLAASHPPQSYNNSDSDTVSLRGSSNIHHLHIFDVQPLCHFQVQNHETPKRHLSTGYKQLIDPAYTSLPLDGPSKLSSLQPDCCCENSALLATQRSYTAPQENLCLNQTCPCRLFCAKTNKDNSTTGFVKARTHAPMALSCSHSYQNKDMKYKNDKNACPLDSDVNTTVMTNSTNKVTSPSSNSESAHGYAPGHISPPSHCCRSSADDKKPLQVLVPQKSARVSQTHSRENEDAQHTAHHSHPSLDNIVSSLHQTPPSDSTRSVSVSHCHNLPSSAAIAELSTEVKTIHGTSNAIPGKDNCNTACRSQYATSFPSTAHNNNSFSSFGSLTNKEDCFCGDGFTVHYPQFMCNHNTHREPVSVCRQNDHTQANLAAKAELEPFSGQDLESLNTDPENAHDSSLQGLSKAGMPYQGQFERNENGIVSSRFPEESNSEHTILPNRSDSKAVNPSCVQERKMISHSNNATYTLSNSNDCPAFQLISLNAGQTKTDGPSSHNNAGNQADQFGQANQLNKQQLSKREALGNTHNINKLQSKGMGYKPGTGHSVQTSYFDANFAGSQEHLVRYNRTSARSSVPSSIDSGHPANREGSLQRSGTSELGIVKPNAEPSKTLRYSNRDTPDYSYLCVVATVLNPPFGIAAFVCNHYARKNYQFHKPVKANNLYFATITISTVAIFATLVGAALLITHSVVRPSDKKLSTFTPSGNSCESRFFCSDEDLKTFFELDFDLYCEVTKSEKIMQALKHYWLEDLANKKKFSKPKAKLINNNASTNSGNVNEVKATFSSLNSSNLYLDIRNETNSNMKGFAQIDDAPENNRDISNSNTGISRPPPESKPSMDDKSSHNTILSSNDGPVVPPELEGEYEQYLKGKERMKVADVNPFLRRTVSGEQLSGEPPTSPETEQTNETTGNY